MVSVDVAIKIKINRTTRDVQLNGGMVSNGQSSFYTVSFTDFFYLGLNRFLLILCERRLGKRLVKEGKDTNKKDEANKNKDESRQTANNPKNQDKRLLAQQVCLDYSSLLLASSFLSSSLCVFSFIFYLFLFYFDFMRKRR